MIRIGVIAVIFFFSCAQKNKVPETILPPDRMDKLLMDMLRAEEFFNQKQADSAFLDSVTRINLYQSVLAANKTNKEDFKRSFTFYESHPEMLKTVLDAMHSQANKKADSSIKTPKRHKISKE
jgi:hypothetical protein